MNKSKTDNIIKYVPVKKWCFTANIPNMRMGYNAKNWKKIIYFWLILKTYDTFFPIQICEIISFFLQMNLMYSFFRVQELVATRVYSDWPDRRFTPYFDITERMLMGIKSSVIADTSWKMEHWKATPRPSNNIAFFGDNTWQIQTPIPHHFVYLIRQTIVFTRTSVWKKYFSFN
jgi:hypothetical protein